MTSGAAQAAASTCPACGWPVDPDDNFCEACREDLTMTQRVVQAVSGSAAGRGSTCPSCPSATVSDEGYCESCGRKVPSDRDHIELDLGLVAAVTDRGLRHSRNEDAVACAVAQLPSGPVVVAAVCDGVSSAPRPDEASRAAAAALLNTTLEGLQAGEDPGDIGPRAVAAAREAMAMLEPPVEGPDMPAVTVVSAVMSSAAVTLCWLGDSRGYWLGAEPGPPPQRLTTDDSVAAEMVAAGVVTEAGAMALPHAHVVTRWLGADLTDVTPHVTTFTPPGPGVLLLCSDGLWNYQPEAAGLAGLAMPGALSDPLGAAVTLTKFAIDAGGMDNITVVLAPFPLATPDGQRPSDDGRQL